MSKVESKIQTRLPRAQSTTIVRRITWMLISARVRNPVESIAKLAHDILRFVSRSGGPGHRLCARPQSSFPGVAVARDRLPELSSNGAQEGCEEGGDQDPARPDAARGRDGLRRPRFIFEFGTRGPCCCFGLRSLQKPVVDVLTVVPS